MSDEFDDLDDYLDEFDEEILSQEPGATVNNDYNDKVGAKSNTASKQDDTIFGDDELKDITKMAQEAGLDAGFANTFADFMKQLDPNSNGNELTALMGEKDNGEEGETESIGGGGGFQSTINETINRLKTSSKQVDEESTKKMDKDEELLTTLLNSLDIDGNGGGFEGMDELKDILSGLDDKGDQQGDEEGIDKVSNILMNMLNKLTSKEMMYDTINTTISNYDGYFQDSRNKTNDSPQDYERYEKQLGHLQNVKKAFDAADYDEADPGVRELIDEEMERYNNLLPPPPGVVQDDLGALGLDNISWNDKDVPEGCVQQ